MQIFLARDNKQAGPYTLDELNSMLSDGQVRLTDLVWHEGMENWQKLGHITGGASYYTGIPAPEPTLDPYVSPNSYTVNSDNPNVSLQKNKPQEAYETKLAPKGKRISATLFDFALFMICFLPAIKHINFEKMAQTQATLEQQMQMAQELVTSLPPSIVAFVNAAVLILLIIQALLLIKRGQTIGKAIMGLRVVDQQSHKVPSFNKIFLVRSLLAGFIFYVLMLFTGPIAFMIYAGFVFINKDGLLPHDKISKTQVEISHNAQLNKN